VDTSFGLILDGIFGFSFEGAIRAPFDSIIATLRACATPIVSIDVPSGWHVEQGNVQGVGLEPQMLVSLTAPKPCASFFTGGDRVHYVGGRFVPPCVRCFGRLLGTLERLLKRVRVVSRSLAREFHLELPTYPGMEQSVRMDL
jgi:NAD(P)H-hydrate epimerase